MHPTLLIFSHDSFSFLSSQPGPPPPSPPLIHKDSLFLSLSLSLSPSLYNPLSAPLNLSLHSRSQLVGLTHTFHNFKLILIFGSSPRPFISCGGVISLIYTTIYKGIPLHNERSYNWYIHFFFSFFFSSPTFFLPSPPPLSPPSLSFTLFPPPQ